MNGESGATNMPNEAQEYNGTESGETSIKQVVPFETESERLKQKCKDLKQKIHEIEEQNQVRAVGISRMKDSVSRLRFEYSLLLEFLESKASSLPIPGLRDFQSSDVDSGSIESLSLSDLTQLLSNIPSDLANIKKSLPNALADLITERQKEFTSNSNNSQSNSSSNSNNSAKNRRKRGNVSGGIFTPAKKRIRDPREPKRPTNAYLFFCDSERDRTRAHWAQERPDEHLDLPKAMTEAWKKMSDEEKKPYFDMYEKDKERYHKAVKEFTYIKEQERLALEQKEEISASTEPATPGSEITFDGKDDENLEHEEIAADDDTENDDDNHNEDIRQSEGDKVDDEIDPDQSSISNIGGNMENEEEEGVTINEEEEEEAEAEAEAEGEEGDDDEEDEVPEEDVSVMEDNDLPVLTSEADELSNSQND